jgi:outer membrane protein assembly factor BamB
MTAMPSPGPRRLRRWGLAAVVLLLIAGGAVALVLLHAPGNVSHPNLSFTSSTTSTSTTTTAKRPVVQNTFEWPRYGYDAGRTRAFAASPRLGPPLRVGWRFNDNALLEFPPVIYANRLFLIGDDGVAKAINKLNGHVLWAHKVGTLAAASPAIGVREGLVFMPVLSTSGHSPGNGRFVALSMKTGRIVWSRPVGAGSESSPMVWGSTVYFGDQSGRMYALRTRDGHQYWSYQASAAIKGGPALSNNILYFGDYAGRAYALNADSGHQLWAVSTSGARFGFGSGQFYATPAVAFGRVYLGNTDGRVYSFAARTGQLAWATGTGAYVYASAAVENTPGLGPTVYVGSYDGHMYAFDARSGAVRWSHNAGAKISGAATIVGNVLYFSVLGARNTLGLNVRTGHQVFFFPDGAFNPVIADPGAIYLVGYTVVYQMLPRPARRARPARSRPRQRRLASHRTKTTHRPRRK